MHLHLAEVQDMIDNYEAYIQVQHHRVITYEAYIQVMYCHHL